MNIVFSWQTKIISIKWYLLSIIFLFEQDKITSADRLTDRNLFFCTFLVNQRWQLTFVRIFCANHLTNEFNEVSLEEAKTTSLANATCHEIDKRRATGETTMLFCEFYLFWNEKCFVFFSNFVRKTLLNVVETTGRVRFNVNVFFDELLLINGYFRRFCCDLFRLLNIDSFDAIEIDGLVSWAIVSVKSFSVTTDPLNDEIDKRSGGFVVVVWRLTKIRREKWRKRHVCFYSLWRNRRTFFVHQLKKTIEKCKTIFFCQLFEFVLIMIVK